MCHNTRLLRVEEASATDDEVRAAALQFVRKIARLRRKSEMTTAPVLDAVDKIAVASRRLLVALESTAVATR
jgi:hypothetical protein